MAGVARPDFVGGQADLEARLNASLAAFADGYAGWSLTREQPDFGASAGVRYRW